MRIANVVHQTGVRFYQQLPKQQKFVVLLIVS